MYGPGDMGGGGFSGPTGAGIGPGETSSSYSGGGGGDDSFGFGTHDDSTGQQKYGGPKNTGDNQAHTQAMFNATKGITSTNPYGNDGFFTRVFGIDPSKISYAGNFSPNAAKDLAIRQGIANNQYDKFANPMRDLGQRPGTVRPGLSAGDMTAFGPVQSQYKEQTPAEMTARGLFGLAGGPLMGGILSQLGTKENVIAGLSPGFDPNNPRGPQGMLGKIASTLSGGLDPTQATARAAAGIQSLRDRFAPSTPTPGVMPVSPPDRPARNPRTGFEDIRSRFSTGVSRPDVNLNVTPSKGLQEFFNQPTPDNPVPGVTLKGVAEQDVRGPRPTSIRGQREGTLYSPTDMYGMLTGQLAPSDLPFTDTSMQNTIERKLSEGMAI